jgi:hypothetical protein
MPLKKVIRCITYIGEAEVVDRQIRHSMPLGTRLAWAAVEPDPVTVTVEEVKVGDVVGEGVREEHLDEEWRERLMEWKRKEKGYEV